MGTGPVLWRIWVDLWPMIAIETHASIPSPTKGGEQDSLLPAMKDSSISFKPAFLMMLR